MLEGDVGARDDERGVSGEVEDLEIVGKGVVGKWRRQTRRPILLCEKATGILVN